MGRWTWIRSCKVEKPKLTSEPANTTADASKASRSARDTFVPACEEEAIMAHCSGTFPARTPRFIAFLRAFSTLFSRIEFVEDAFLSIGVGMFVCKADSSAFNRVHETKKCSDYE